jgi:uncharacterized protein (TIGR03663 family)
MTRAGGAALVAVALAAGLAFRVARLDVRPMHHDEANQAVKFGALLERGEYRYDAHDHHGPTLYYLTLPAAWLRGEHTLASLDERTLRGVTAAFGAATILLLPLLSDAVGRTAVACGAILMALSPAMVFYSRMYIQESLFAFFTLLFVIATGHAVRRGGSGWAVLAGAAAGLAIATKETSAIVLPAALAACALAWWSLGHSRQAPIRLGVRSIGIALAVAAAVAGLFYSSFLTDPAGAIAPFTAVFTYVDRGVTPAAHAHPWHYYIGLLTYSASGGMRWSEGLVIALAAAGAVSAFVGVDRADPTRTFWARYLTGTVAITAAIFSALPYKTPWNLLPFYAVAIVLAGLGFSWLFHALPGRVFRASLIAGFVLACGQLGMQAWRASVTYASDPRNPYVYAQTVPDAVRMATRIRELAALHPDGSRMQVSVIASPYEQWPLPWYLRTMPNVGYWTAPDDGLALHAPVIVTSLDYAGPLAASLDERYVSEFYGLRPEVFLALYIERGLWDRFLSRVAGSPGGVPCIASEPPGPEGSGVQSATRSMAGGDRFAAMTRAGTASAR